MGRRSGRAGGPGRRGAGSSPGRGSRDRRGIGKRQDHSGPVCAASRQAVCWNGRAAWKRLPGVAGEASAATTWAAWSRIPGPIFLAEPADADRSDRGRATASERKAAAQRREREGDRASRARGYRAPPHEPVSARAEWGAAPTCGYRPGPGDGSGYPRGGRAGLGSRCVGSGPGSKSPAGSEERRPAGDALHLARPGRGGADRGPHRGHVRRADRRVGRDGPADIAAAAPVHAGAAIGRSQRGPGLSPRSRATPG